MTLATIAEELGVSRMTVSNAYNRPEKLSPDLRRRVLAKAKQLGYPGPDPVAATLSRGRVATKPYQSSSAESSLLKPMPSDRP